ncbi:MAG: alpha-glucan family phosphorylase [Pyrinomonadaceae bacterium]
MHHATSAETEPESPITASIRKLPENLEFLDTLSRNYYWSWNSDAAELFRDLDPEIWESCEQNPRELLAKVSDLRLWQKAVEPDYTDKLELLRQKFERYISERPKAFGQITAENPVAYFCAEYGVHNSLPIYSGGLGILAGDHLKSASDMNMPLIGIGLLYSFGYFRQKIGHDGWQQENYHDVFDAERALSPVLDENGNRILVYVDIAGRTVSAQIWLAKVGRISLYLLDTGVEENDQIDRLITGHLYGGDSETRVVQEKVLGIGGVHLLRKLGITPSVYHLNEGHSAFLTLELARECIANDDRLTFEDAISLVRQKCVFTTHTPVAAGNDNFPPELIDEYFSGSFHESLKLSRHDFLALGRTNPDDEAEWFGMTPLAIRMARSANGVSEKHGEVSRDLWLKMFPDGTSANEVPITHITNGVHPPTWIAPPFKRLFEKHIGSNWPEIISNPGEWETAVNLIPSDEIWQTHQSLKSLLVAFVRERTLRRNTGHYETINERVDTQKLFDEKILTIGFARRVAAYKRWNLLMTDLPRLLKMVDDANCPVQFVFAGKAHPQDRKAKKILQNLMSINHESKWQHRAVFIEDYDQEVARYLVQGVDVWMNVPRRPLEASGTSGQKAAMNGGLNFSVLDGWWIEGFNEINGFAVGGLSASAEDDHTSDLSDAAALYDVLENMIIPDYYELDEHALPAKWISRMRNAISTLTPQFSSDRMVNDYFERIYAPE